MSRNINDIFEEDENLREPAELDAVEVESKGTVEDILDDYNFVRENLIRSIVRGSELIDTSVQEAKTSPSPRAVEAAANAVKVLTDSSKSLLDLHEKIRDIDKNNSEKLENNENNENIDKKIIRSTLSELIKKIEEEDLKTGTN